MSKVVIASGYFDPLHVGHIEYLKRAKECGDYLMVIVNNDEQAKLKKGKAFMPAEDRMSILRALKYVDGVFLSTDKDESVKETLTQIVKDFYEFDTVIFAKGGDRTTDNIPERDVCRELGIYILTGLGGKVRSSSDFIKKAKEEPNE